MKKSYFIIYILRLFIVNASGIIFLYDTTSFNQGLFSIQSIFYSINSILLYTFLFAETVFTYLQYYGLDLEFLNLILLDITNIDYEFAFLILLEKSNYLLFLIFNLILLINLNSIINFFLKKKKLFLENKLKISVGLTTFIFLFLLIPIDLNKKIIKKIININSTFEQYSFFRNDNWLISIKSIYIYREGQNKSFDKHLFIEDFSNIINFNEYKNIFIIINESYPNFKNKLLKDKLYKIILHNNENDIIVNNYKKDWSKKYSTQGAELNLFCGQKKNFLEFKNKSLEKYIVDNDCYFQKYKTVNKTFIHTYKLETFNRLRYKNYFEKIIGLTYLKKLNLDMCEGSFFSICDHTVLPVIRNFLYEGSNLVILLTVNNHVPQVLISKSNLINCREHHPLNINKNICSSFHNQLLFNKALSSFISQLKKNELLIFYSDTPPIFPLRERIHFEDYIDVYTFEKK